MLKNLLLANVLLGFPEQSNWLAVAMMMKNILHDWERKNIMIKDKKTEIGRWLQQTILSLGAC